MIRVPYYWSQDHIEMKILSQDNVRLIHKILSISVAAVGVHNKYKNKYCTTTR